METKCLSSWNADEKYYNSTCLVPGVEYAYKWLIDVELDGVDFLFEPVRMWCGTDLYSNHVDICRKCDSTQDCSNRLSNHS